MTGKKREAFIESLGTLVESECTAREALTVLAKEDEAAGALLERIERGELFSAAFCEEGFAKGSQWKGFLALFETTGRLDQGLALMSESLERSGRFASRLAGCLAYPLLVLLLCSAVSLLALAVFLPALQNSNLPLDALSLERMRTGALTALVFPLVSVPACAAFFVLPLARREKEAAFWAVLERLASSKLPLDQCLRASGASGGIEAREPYLYYSLSSAETTGDYERAFAKNSRYCARRLDDAHELSGKLMEPALLGIGGIDVLLLAWNFFLPILSAAGSIGA